MEEAKQPQPAVELRYVDAMKIEFTKALVKVQAVMKPAAKGSINKFLNNAKYSDLADVWDACRVPLTENGFAVVQEIDTDKDGVHLTTTLRHIGGYAVDNTFWLPVPTPKAKVNERGEELTREPAANDFGAVISLARKFGLAALVGVVSDDSESGQTARAQSTTRSMRPAARTEPAPQWQSTDAPGATRSHQPVKFRYGPKKDSTSFDADVTEEHINFYIGGLGRAAEDPSRVESRAAYTLEIANLQAELRWRTPPA